MKVLMTYLILSTVCVITYSQPINLTTFYDKFGLKNINVSQQIEAQWNSLKKINSYFYLGEKSGSTYIYYYDEDLNELVRINYLLSEPTIYSNQLVIVQQYGKNILKGVMNCKGKEILPVFYSNIQIVDNYILAEFDKRISVYDLQGKKLISENFTYIQVKNNFIYAKIEDNRFPAKERYIVYNPQLKIITHQDWNPKSTFGKDNLLLIETLTNEQFYIDTQGEIKIKPLYQINFESPFSNGYAIISSQTEEKKFGFIDTSGKVVIPMEYHEVSPFQTQYAYFSKKTQENLLEGLIDNKNHIKKIFPDKVISKSVYYDSNKATYYLSNHETYDVDGNFKEDTNLIR